MSHERIITKAYFELSTIRNYRAIDYVSRLGLLNAAVIVSYLTPVFTRKISLLAIKLSSIKFYFSDDRFFFILVT